MQQEVARVTTGALEIEWRSAGDVLAVSWAGRLDQSSADAAHRCLEPALAGTRDIAVDCAHLTMISSLGIRVVILLHKHAKSRGGSLTLTSLQPQVRDVLEFAGINRLLGVPASPSASGR